MKNTTSIFGCGWLGKPLALYLLEKDFQVKGSTTSEEKMQELKEEGIDAQLIPWVDENNN